MTREPNPIAWSRAYSIVNNTVLGTYGWLVMTNYWLGFGISVCLGFLVHGILHMYFSHRSFAVSRPVQFIFAVLASLSGQESPLVWATFHRRHHRHSDTELDPHSPQHLPFFEAFLGWSYKRKNCVWDAELVRDLVRYPELVWLARYHAVILTGFVFAWFVAATAYYKFVHFLGWPFALEAGFKNLCMWYCAPVFYNHLISGTVNTLNHMWGSKAYDTRDASTNIFVLSFTSVGASWHNNHHAQPQAINCGHKWWHLDLTYYFVWVLHKLRIVQSMKVYKQPEK